MALSRVCRATSATNHAHALCYILRPWSSALPPKAKSAHTASHMLTQPSTSGPTHTTLPVSFMTLKSLGRSMALTQRLACGQQFSTGFVGRCMTERQRIWCCRLNDQLFANELLADHAGVWQSNVSSSPVSEGRS